MSKRAIRIATGARPVAAMSVVAVSLLMTGAGGAIPPELGKLANL